jgi:hypothetical protein
MIRARAFEEAFRAAANSAPLYGTAGQRKTIAPKRWPIKAALSDEEIEAALRAAATRLKEHPELLSGDPNGVFTFEDPVLAAALYWLRKSEASHKNLYGAAGKVPGEKLKEGWYRPSWIKTGVRAILSHFSTTRVQLAAMTPDAPVITQAAPLRIAVCGDAGFVGVAQDKVIRMILSRHRIKPFDFAIHLGDVYFAGDVNEMALNFLQPFSRLTKAGIRLFTLVGNHDLYYGGTSFVFAMNMLQQPGRYFLIESPYWRIACLDTSLGAVHVAGDDAQLDEKQLEWLDSILAKEDARPVVVMSHHFAISGWGVPPVSLTSQLNDRFNKDVFAWYWGHEHNCALYAKNGSTNYWGACVGNGSFIETWNEPTKQPAPVWFAQKFCTCFPHKGAPYRPHGYIELEFHKDRIEETAHIENRETYARTMRR